MDLCYAISLLVSYRRNRHVPMELSSACLVSAVEAINPQPWIWMSWIQPRFATGNYHVDRPLNESDICLKHDLPAGFLTWWRSTALDIELDAEIRPRLY